MRYGFSLLVAVALVGLAISPASAQWFARGSYYNGWGADAGNELNDTGVNGDVTAGDGVFSALVTSTEVAGSYEFKVALGDWSESHPNSNVPLTLTSDFQTVLFTFDTNAHGDGWYPDANIVWADAVTPGTTWGLVGGAPELGNWDPVAGPQANLNAGVWEALVDFAAGGDFEYKWTADQQWGVQQLGSDGYGNNTSNVLLSVPTPGQYLFRYDPATGRGWHGENVVPVEATTWGNIKALYD